MIQPQEYYITNPQYNVSPSPQHALWDVDSSCLSSFPISSKDGNSYGRHVSQSLMCPLTDATIFGRLQLKFTEFFGELFVSQLVIWGYVLTEVRHEA